MTFSISAITSFTLRGAAWLIFVSIAILSWVPPTFRPHVSSSDKLEHFSAYFVLAVLFVLAYPHRPKLTLLATLMVAYAGALEAGQIFVPGRTVSLADFAWSVFGGTAGMATTMAARKLVSQSG